MDFVSYAEEVNTRSIKMKPVRLKNMKEFRKLAIRSGQIKPLTNEELTKRLEKLEKKVHALEMMIMDTRAGVLSKNVASDRR